MKLELIYGGVVGAVAVLGWLWYIFGKTKQVDLNTVDIATIKKDREEAMDMYREDMQMLKLTQNSLEVALYGFDGSNGMRSDIRELKADIKVILSHLPHRRESDKEKD